MLPEASIAQATRAGAYRTRSMLVREAAQRWVLTDRQGEVLEFLARGLSNKAIATQLGCAARTVEIHVAVILERASASSRCEVIALLLEMSC